MVPRILFQNFVKKTEFCAGTYELASIRLQRSFGNVDSLPISWEELSNVRFVEGPLMHENLVDKNCICKVFPLHSVLYSCGPFGLGFAALFVHLSFPLAIKNLVGLKCHAKPKLCTC